MSDGHRFVQAMRRVSQPSQNEIVDIVVGQVTSVKPLKVKVDKLELTEAFLIVGALCKETHIYTDNVFNLSHTHVIPPVLTDVATSGDKHEHKVPRNTSGTPESEEYDILLWRGLQEGDHVLMLKVGRGQKYFILQRQEGVIAT